ncbi:DUF1214 domain-containing protein [Aurantimonas marina]|uniref:DUF1214 domain-containing protein n=1 Tax=Aurantimonas marina TaxID=2780508 RepID=UPI0019CFA89B|nr:DUF1214 domain-containing protein [Aurantimonas marina]
MRFTLLVLIALAIALGLGGWSANRALEESAEIGTVAVGPWAANPFAGSPDADPYAKARLARLGNLTLGIGEGILFTADRDSSDAPLRRQCQYRIAGHTPPTRIWTLAPYTPEGRLIQPGAGRAGWLTSHNLMRAEDNSFAVAIGPMARAGNWLATSGRGPLVLALALYDTPASASSGVDSLSLPDIELETCFDG